MKKSIAIAFLMLSIVFVSCDQEFNTIGSDLVGDEHFDFNKEVIEGDHLKAYSVKTELVQTNNLQLNPIGFYKNPYFGDTKANYVSNVTLPSNMAKFGTNVQMENVTLYIPYFYKSKTTDADGASTYVLDSIYGANPESKMKLNIFENGYVLNSFDAADQSLAAIHYQDMDNLINAQKRGNDGNGNSIMGGNRLNDNSSPDENDQFFFNKEEIKIYKTKFNPTSGVIEYLDAAGNVTTDPTKYVVDKRLSPGIYLNLNKQFFKKKILEAPADVLVNNNAFKQYFKGLYFQMEQIAGQEGAMAMLNFNNAILNVNYYSLSEGASTASSKTLQLSLGTNSVSNSLSLQDYSYSTAYNTGLSSAENIVGTPNFGKNEKLYLKGGKGSIVYIEIDQARLDEIKAKKYLVNDAYIEFYVEQPTMSQQNQKEPERIYLFDATNQKPLVDYVFDASSNNNPKKNKATFDGIIRRDSNKKGEKYKIRITQHINNLLNSTNVNVNKNVKLGLSITESISEAGSLSFKAPSVSGNDVKKLPKASVMSQQGTVIHGTHSTDANKKLKVVIHYTKPN